MCPMAVHTGMPRASALQALLESCPLAAAGVGAKRAAAAAAVIAKAATAAATVTAAVVVAARPVVVVVLGGIAPVLVVFMTVVCSTVRTGGSSRCAQRGCHPPHHRSCLCDPWPARRP